MNIERLDIIARWLEAGGEANGIPLRFDMREIFLGGYDAETNTSKASCGTACCIAGAALTKWGPGYYLCGDLGGGWGGATDLLDLTEHQADLLFAPSDYAVPCEASTNAWPCDHKDIDAAWAARTIRHLIATGEVRWDITREASA